ncbi:GAF domain-containing sensor histidine kinase [Domibacillus sp. A3M-37]|uniref:sensor histidine kinase n=1 Tax=Domibacillus sp. A3M-37 TaxID=2962037 RepID=UPI0020B8030B|nr:GAF domain-containing sensor histidine kinase [Domibacillus sp. A3M-37]MCP3762105.1 GAF domain-containing sensor histidine kinase [Domibacillus sp. A3M-37]
MELKDKNIEIYQKPLNDSYFILDEKLCIKEVHIDNCDLFTLPNSSLKGRLLKDVLTEDYLQFFEHIFSRIQKGTPAIFEFSIKNNLAMEVKIYPSRYQITVVLKDKTKLTHINQILKESNKKISFLSEVSNDIILSKEPKQLLTSLFDKISAYLDLDLYFNYILDDKKQKIRLTNYQGISEEVAKEIEWLEMGQAVCGTVARDQTRIVAEDVSTSSDPMVQLIKGLGVKSYVCHPLFSNGKLLGTLSFGSNKREKFTSDELEVVDQVCKQVAISLERGFLITKLEEKNEALEYSNYELSIAKEESDQGNKAKTEFLLLMSHEFRTPLNAINGFIQILLSDLQNPLSEEQRNRLEKMRKASKQLQFMINDILDFVRYDIGTLNLEFDYMDINDIINDCIHSIISSANRKDINIYYHELNTNVLIYSDSKRVEQVIINLISNAVKYNTERGKVFIKSTIEDKNLIIEVKDTGVGISENELSLIFSPFYRSPSNFPSIEGTGIGLALVRKIVDKLGGDVSVISSVGKGSSFVVKIPIGM